MRTSTSSPMAAPTTWRARPPRRRRRPGGGGQRRAGLAAGRCCCGAHHPLPLLLPERGTAGVGVEAGARRMGSGKRWRGGGDGRRAPRGLRFRCVRVVFEPPPLWGEAQACTLMRDWGGEAANGALCFISSCSPHRDHVIDADYAYHPHLNLFSLTHLSLPTYVLMPQNTCGCLFVRFDRGLTSGHNRASRSLLPCLTSAPTAWVLSADHPTHTVRQC